MVRGISGFIWGAIVSLLALAGLSVGHAPVTLPEAEQTAGAPRELEPAGQVAGQGGGQGAGAPSDAGSEEAASGTGDASDAEADVTIEEAEAEPAETTSPEPTQEEAEPGTGDSQEVSEAGTDAVTDGGTDAAGASSEGAEVTAEAAPESRPAARPARRPESAPPPQVSTDTPAMAAPDEETASPLEEADTAPAARPETGETELALASPGEGQATGGVSVEGDSPVAAGDQGAAPQAPEGETELSISTDPAQPRAPEVAPEEQSAFPDDGETPGDASESSPQGDSSAADDAGPSQPAPPEENAAGLSVEGADPAEPPAQDTDGAPAPEADTVPAQAPDATSEEVGSEAPAGGVSVEESGPAEADENAAPSEAEEEAAGMAPAGTLEDIATGVETGRLPSIGAEDEAAEPAVEDEAGPSGGEPAEADALPPIRANAAPVEVDPEKPRMSIVLIDEGGTPIGIEALEAFPYPLTFAVDATREGAAATMADYRARGFEVVAMASLPAGAAPSDAEVTMETVLRGAGEAVAVMESSDNGLSQDRAVAEQVAGILAESGHGLVLFPKGLNTARSLAERAGVPAATVFREFDAGDETPSVIRRFLDQAAFRAGQEGDVIMVGRIRPDTISALLLWGLQDRASSVALVPVSQILLHEDDG